MTVLCKVSEIEEESARGFDIDGQSVFAVKKDGQLFVYINSCPHIGIPLEFQPDEFLDMEKRFIQCANHGALFEIETGDCIAGPCAGQALKAVPFNIEDEHIRLI
ncbi:Rieske (2Fe-2S) protein [Ketobacter alkanivorans]|uniref:(2Fe-2S)-binding protein n=1 Tax=Ketobacter alkanivorans TaxID=1917421 RepID=A0A2K9LNS1_9GAMM|nr:Rieske (2Fe-2S) protein [Ketobacter alkanivorans]AUM13900.1 (2Fe-2S)-binding protein [Ketobacter alkanivorans]MCP5017961.1 Rieske (2Fe-2S) protein [Ketobacter sp.]